MRSLLLNFRGERANRGDSCVNKLLRVRQRVATSRYVLAIPLDRVIGGPLNVLRKKVATAVVSSTVKALTTSLLPRNFKTIAARLGVRCLTINGKRCIAYETAVSRGKAGDVMLSTSMLHSSKEGVTRTANDFFVVRGGGIGGWGRIKG